MHCPHCYGLLAVILFTVAQALRDCTPVLLRWAKRLERKCDDILEVAL